MSVKLRILHGKLQKRKGGGSAGFDVKIRGPRFVIGSGPDCSLCCKSSTVSVHHCEIRLDEKDRAVVRDLRSEEGTYVNDELVATKRVLKDGDILRVGRLEFEVVGDRPPAVDQPEEPPIGKKRRKRPGERVADFLDDADERDRLRRLKDPDSRVMHLEEILAESATQEEEPEEPVEEEPKKKRPPKKKKPGKLPPKPPLITDNSAEAAEELLRKMLKGGP